MKTKIILTDEKLQDIYTCEKFRNQIAYAHQRCDKYGNFIEHITCSYPVTYVVTPEQIKAAQAEINRKKAEVIQTNKNVLVFIGMGMDYEPRYNDDVCNHRIRTEFINKHGRKFFIEVGTWGSNKMRCDHSIDRDLQEKKDEKIKQEEAHKQSYNNYKGLERAELGEYTFTNLLNLINREFECNFKKIIVDNYNLGTDDIICISPK